MALIRIVAPTFIIMCLASNITSLSNDESVHNQQIKNYGKDQTTETLKSSQVHSIDIHEMKHEFEEAIDDATKIMLEMLQDISPSLYDKIETSYLPKIKSFKKEFAPIYEKLILPRIHKLKAYTKRMGGRMFNKVHQSWELSNSTHINIVSFVDILDDILNDIETHRHIFSQISRRAKRSLPFMSRFMAYARPLFKNVATNIARSIDGQDSTLTTQMILPIIFEMIDDPVTFNDLQKLFWSTQSVVSPIVYETIKRHQYGGNYHIPQATIDSALRRLDYETMPIVRKVVERHLPMILRRVSQNVRLIMKTIDRVEARSGPRMHVLRMQIIEFLKKHGDMFGSTGQSYINSHTLIAIKRDWLPIKVTLFKIFMDYMSYSPNAWGNFLVNSFSMMGHY